MITARINDHAEFILRMRTDGGHQLRIRGGDKFVDIDPHLTEAEATLQSIEQMRQGLDALEQVIRRNSGQKEPS